VRAFLLQSLDVAGKRWRLNLDALSANMDAILAGRRSRRKSEAETLFLSGGASDYVQRRSPARDQGTVPNAKFAKIPGAGHWLHAEKPREFEAALRAYLTPERVIRVIRPVFHTT
jgi:esterase